MVNVGEKAPGAGRRAPGRASATVSGLEPGAWSLGPAAIAVAMAVLSACAPRVPPPDLSLEPAALLAQVREAAARVRSVQGQARVKVTGPAGAVVQVFVAAERPDRLHVETLDFFGNPAAALAAADGRLAIWDPKARAFYTGRATAANVARLVPLALEPGDLVAVLCGAPPLAGEPVRATPGRGAVELELRDGPRTTTLRVVAGAAVARATVRDPRTGDWEAEYGVRAPSGGVPDVTLRGVGREDVQVELGWKDVEANATIDGAMFRMTPRPGARVVDLDQLAGAP
jgi:hypothetical protein